MDPDLTAPIGAVCSGSTQFASILNLSVLLGNYLQQTISADDTLSCIFFLALEGFNDPVSSKRYTLACEPIEDSDQPRYPRSLIRAFVGRSMGSQVSNVSSGGKLRL